MFRIPLPTKTFVAGSLIRSGALVALLVLAACGAKSPDGAPSRTDDPRYAEMLDGDRVIIAVEPRYLTDQTRRKTVAYTGDEDPGSIVVDPYARVLYHVMEGGQAERFGIAVGREGLAFRGAGVISRKEEWPSWTPTRNMLRTQPETYGEFAGGLPGGLDNPLGSRALYLYRNGKDSYFRIHGTIDNSSIGRATSAGCIRLYNQDAIYLYDKIELGSRVRVRTLEESIALEGPTVDDAFGFAIPAALAPDQPVVTSGVDVAAEGTNG